MDWLAEFPSLGKRDLRDLKKGIDGSFREWSRSCLLYTSDAADE